MANSGGLKVFVWPVVLRYRQVTTRHDPVMVPDWNDYGEKTMRQATDRHGKPQTTTRHIITYRETTTEVTTQTRDRGLAWDLVRDHGALKVPVNGSDLVSVALFEAREATMQGSKPAPAKRSAVVAW